MRCWNNPAIEPGPKIVNESYVCQYNISKSSANVFIIHGLQFLIRASGGDHGLAVLMRCAVVREVALRLESLNYTIYDFFKSMNTKKKGALVKCLALI